MFNAVTEGFENLGFTLQEVGAREVHRRSVVGVQGAIARQQFKESEQFLHQFALRQRSELATLCFFQEWSAGEERQASCANEHRLQLVENLGGVDDMLVTMLPSCHTVEERHPIRDAGLFQLMALFQDVLRGIALVDALQRPVITTLHAKRDFVHPDVLQLTKLLNGLVLDVRDSRGSTCVPVQADTS